MVEMINIRIDLEGDVTEAQYAAINEKLPDICQSLGLTGSVTSNFTIE